MEWNMSCCNPLSVTQYSHMITLIFWKGKEVHYELLDWEKKIMLSVFAESDLASKALVKYDWVSYLTFSCCYVFSLPSSKNHCFCFSLWLSWSNKKYMHIRDSLTIIIFLSKRKKWLFVSHKYILFSYASSSSPHWHP